jgi:hypothetical protein
LRPHGIGNDQGSPLVGHKPGIDDKVIEQRVVDIFVIVLVQIAAATDILAVNQR